MVDIGGGKVVPCGSTNRLELLSHSSAGFTAARQVESLPDPLGDRHAAGARDTLNLPVFAILENHLQALGHGYESI
jgi:hypothetical protein